MKVLNLRNFESYYKIIVQTDIQIIAKSLSGNEPLHFNKEPFASEADALSKYPKLPILVSDNTFYILDIRLKAKDLIKETHQIEIFEQDGKKAVAHNSKRVSRVELEAILRKKKNLQNGKYLYHRLTHKYLQRPVLTEVVYMTDAETPLVRLFGYPYAKVNQSHIDAEESAAKKKVLKNQAKHDLYDLSKRYEWNIFEEKGRGFMSELIKFGKTVDERFTGTIRADQFKSQGDHRKNDRGTTMLEKEWSRTSEEELIISEPEKEAEEGSSEPDSELEEV